MNEIETRAEPVWAVSVPAAIPIDTATHAPENHPLIQLPGGKMSAIAVSLDTERTVAMKEILADIRRRLRDGDYRNEEHVRLSLVARVLQKVGWDIWNPREANAEFVVVPDEDNAKVDFALFSAGVHKVYIEVKAVGKITNLEQTERQLRDYNRNNTALFCVITDGQEWRLYYSQTGGEFSKKCFKVLDLLKDNLDDIEHSLTTFLSKQEILVGKAEEEAKSILRLTQKQRVMEESFRGAEKMTKAPPFPSFPDALVDLLSREGFSVTREEAASFIEETTKKKSDEDKPVLPPMRRSGNIEPPPAIRNPDNIITEFGQFTKELLTGAGSFEVLRVRSGDVVFLPQSWAKVIPENGTAVRNFTRAVSVACYFECKSPRSLPTRKRIRLWFGVRPMDDPKLRQDCVNALKNAGFRVREPFSEEPRWSTFYSREHPVSNPGDEYEVREVVEKLLAEAKSQFPRVEAVLTNVFRYHDK